MPSANATHNILRFKGTAFHKIKKVKTSKRLYFPYTYLLIL